MPSFPVRSQDIGVISALKLTGVLLGVLGPLLGALMWFQTTQVAAAIRIQSAVDRERFVTVEEYRRDKADLSRQLDKIDERLVRIGANLEQRAAK
jgi:hypothetical protein